MLAASTLQLLGNLHRLFREAKSGCWLRTAFTRSFSGGDFQPTTNPDHMKHCGWCLLGFNITAVACSAVHKHHLQPGHSLSDAGMASATAIEEERRAWYSVARIPLAYISRKSSSEHLSSAARYHTPWLDAFYIRSALHAILLPATDFFLPLCLSKLLCSVLDRGLRRRLSSNFVPFARTLGALYRAYNNRDGSTCGLNIWQGFGEGLNAFPPRDPESPTSVEPQPLIACTAEPKHTQLASPLSEFRTTSTPWPAVACRLCLLPMHETHSIKACRHSLRMPCSKSIGSLELKTARAPNSKSTLPCRESLFKSSICSGQTDSGPKHREDQGLQQVQVRASRLYSMHSTHTHRDFERFLSG